MPSPWSYLGSNRLEESIGPEILESLTKILPAIRPSINPNEIYTREFLAGIFDSFVSSSSFQDRSFRSDLFQRMPTPKLVTAVTEAGLSFPPGVGHQELVRLLMTLSWRRDDARSLKAAESLGINPAALQVVSADVNAETTIPKPATAYRQLKDYQADVFYRAIAALENPRTRFIVQMPTGSGKTRTAVEIAATVLNSSQKPSQLIVWLAHSQELCEQAASAFEDIWKTVGSSDLKLVRWWGNARPKITLEDGPTFIVMSFQTAHSLVKGNSAQLDTINARLGLLIVDEAHKVLAPTYKSAVLRLINADTQVIGLTATPGRSIDNAEENKELADFFFSERIAIQPHGELSAIDYLRQRRVLSLSTYRPLLSSTTRTLNAKEKKYLAEFLDIPPSVLKDLAEDEVRNIEIAKVLDELLCANRHVIFFACSVDHSQFICSLMTALGHPSAHIDGKTPRGQRQRALDDFRAGDVRLLSNFEVLSTGFDAPSIDVVFIARPTNSIVLYSQMIGRGLRGPAIGGTESCTVVDVKDNIDGFANENAMYSFFEEYFVSPEVC